MIQAPAHRSEPKSWQVSLTAGLVVAIASMDLTLLGTAIAMLGGSDENSDFTQLAWILIVAVIPMAYLMLPALARANRTGRKGVASKGMLLFTVGAIIAAVAPFLSLVVFGRLVQAGIALGLAGTLAILGSRARSAGSPAYSGWAAASVLGFLVGPLLAGALLQFATWRSLFVAEAILGAIAYLMIRTYLVESRADEPPPRSDFIGAVFLGIGLLLIAWGFLSFSATGITESLPTIDNSNVRWMLSHSPLGWVLVVAGGVVVFAGIIRLRRNRRNRPRAGIPRAFQLTGVAIGVALSAALVTNTLYLSGVDTQAPWLTALWLLPFLLTVSLTLLVVRLVLRPSRAWPLVVLGGLIWLGSLGYALSVASALKDAWPVWTALLTFQGLGIGLLAAVTGDPRPLAGSIRQTGDAAMVAVAGLHAARQFGAAVGIVALTLLFLGGQLREVLILERGWALAGLAGATAAILWFVSKRTDSFKAEVHAPAQAIINSPTGSGRRRGELRRRPTAAILDFLRQRDLDPLATLPMFAGLSQIQRERMAEESEEIYVAAGEHIYSLGDSADAIYIIRSGRVDLEIDGNCVGRLGRGAVFGETEVLDGRARSVTAVARRDASLMRIRRSTIMEVEDVAFFRSIAISLSRRLTEVAPAFDVEGSSTAEATISVIAVDIDAPTREVGRAIEELLQLHCAVMAPGRVDRLGLERAESLGDLVLLIDDPSDHEWSTFCRRVADRTIAVTTKPAPVERVPRGAHVVIVDQDPTPQQLTEWFEQVHPASRSLVRSAHLAEDLAPLADRLLHRSLGIAFGGGGARGLAHIGVMDVLTGAGIRVDRIAGTSMGALVGACFAAKLDPDSVDALCFDLMVRGNPMSDYRVPRTSLLRGKRIDDAVKATFGDIRIETLPIPFACVSVDLVKRQEIVHRSGSLADAVASSSRLPGILPPYRDAQGGVHVDGGLLNNLPVNVLDRREGPIIAVQVGSQGALSEDMRLEEISFADTIMRSLMMASDNANAEAIERADVHIRPDTSSAGLTEFHRIDAMREAGQRAAEEALPLIQELLKTKQ